MNYTVTFTYATGATQTLVVDSEKLLKGTSLKALFEGWRQDLKAERVEIAVIQ